MNTVTVPITTQLLSSLRTKFEIKNVSDKANVETFINNTNATFTPKLTNDGLTSIDANKLAKEFNYIEPTSYDTPWKDEFGKISVFEKNFLTPTFQS
jgi:hypothetical protein